MGNHLKQSSHDRSLVRPIHTVVKGRARYKIEGLDQEKALEKYLESRLPQEEKILQVRANYWTGNVLVIFEPEIDFKAIASLLQNLVLDYQKERNQSSIKKPVFSPAPETTKNAPTNKSNLNRLVIFNQEQNYAPWSKTKNFMQKHLNRSSNQIVLGTSMVGMLALTTLLMHSTGLDTAILLTIQKLHTPLLDRIMLGITFLGEPIVLLSLCLVSGMGLFLERRYREATTLGIVGVGAIGLNYWLKLLFGRARPELWDRLIDVGLHSFPSGHAMVSMAIYTFLGYCLAKQFPQRPREICVLTAILIGAIGFSRLYLGVHWPTDVAAGYAIGLMWAITWILSSQPLLKTNEGNWY
ncbi:phosphoesterase, PA-phosphatase related [Stanieria sp. NIES-3757]|nr:phosphoesterase, PA-phosphatase related [Stanieria sp. NIES-3757]